MTDNIKINNKIELPCALNVPKNARGLVIFVHGWGSGKESSRNKYIAGELAKFGFATLLFDLLTVEENKTYDKNVFDMDLLTERLYLTVCRILDDKKLSKLPVGLNGASTGAAAALNVAAKLGKKISAIVSRGGRPDLAEQANLRLITAPTLFIVGGDDAVCIPWNKKAAKKLKSPHQTVLVPGATHIFPEPGKIEEAAVHTVAWFLKWLS